MSKSVRCQVCHNRPGLYVELCLCPEDTCAPRWVCRRCAESAGNVA